MTGPTAPSPTSADDFRRVLGAVPTSVAVIAGAAAGAPVGVSVGTFASVSLAPPLVGFFIARTSSTWPLIEPSGGFCASVLAADQEDVCRAFAAKGVDRFATCSWRWSARGRPILAGAVAWLDCDIDRVVEAGDHLLVLGAVREMDGVAGGSPLVFVNGGYARVRGPGGDGWA